MEEAVRAKAIDLLGEAKPVSREPMKDTLMSFREGHIYVALKMVSSFDKESQSYQQPQPKIIINCPSNNSFTFRLNL